MLLNVAYNGMQMEKNRDERRKSHQNTIYKYMLESIAVYISVRCKQFQPYTTLNFAQPCVLLARLSPSETIHLVVVPVPRRDSYITGEKVENHWSKHRMCCSLSIRDI